MRPCPAAGDGDTRPVETKKAKKEIAREPVKERSYETEEGKSSYAGEQQDMNAEPTREADMGKKKRRYKEVIRDRIVSLRMNEQEFFRLKANALRDRTSVSRLVRDRVTELTQG